MSNDNKAWRQSGEYLPKFMRDFHDQKDLFKTIHEAYKSEASETSINAVTWVDAHIYTVDCFLWFMASHGYTLQKSRKRVAHYDIEASLRDARNIRDQRFAEAFSTMMKRERTRNETVCCV